MDIMKTYKGLYTIKNPEKYQGNPQNVIYRSMWERNCFRWCDENPKVKSWSSEEVIIPYYYEIDKKYHRYFVDLKITYTDGKTYLVEIKPEKETNPPVKPGSRTTRRYLTESMTYVKNQNKWKSADEYSRDRGWEFQIWTEVTLRKMGILPKPAPKLKSLGPVKKKPKKPKKRT